MATFDQDTINTLVADFQQAAAAATPPAKINAAPSPATIAEKFVEDPYKTGINPGTSNGKKLYQDATKEMDSKDLITVNAKNARNFETQIKKRLNLHHWQHITGNICGDDAKDFEFIQGYNSLTVQHLKQHAWRNYISSHGDIQTDPPDNMLMVSNNPSADNSQKERFDKRI